jgi:hypothetical protein
MRCQRCWGLVIVETPPFTDECTETSQTVRCVNCGWVEDPVMRTNRLTSNRRDKIIPTVIQSRSLLA